MLLYSTLCIYCWGNNQQNLQKSGNITTTDVIEVYKNNFRFEMWIWTASSPSTERIFKCYNYLNLCNIEGTQFKLRRVQFFWVGIALFNTFATFTYHNTSVYISNHFSGKKRHEKTTSVKVTNLYITYNSWNQLLPCSYNRISNQTNYLHTMDVWMYIPWMDTMLYTYNISGKRSTSHGQLCLLRGTAKLKQRK